MKKLPVSLPVVMAPILVIGYVAVRVRYSFDSFVIPHANASQQKRVMSYRPVLLESEGLSAAPPGAIRQSIREWNERMANGTLPRLTPVTYDDWVLENTIRGQIVRELVTRGNALISQAGVDRITQADDAEQVFRLTERLRTWDATAPTVVAVTQRRCIELIRRIEFFRSGPILNRLRLARTPMSKIIEESRGKARESVLRLQDPKLEKDADEYLRKIERLASLADANAPNSEFIELRSLLRDHRNPETSVLDAITYAVSTDRKTTQALYHP